ncbi:hypothetical protein [Burkholderia cenocepacia]|uniref:hypothetical protein n=1 Tax=Burkholderia cenocepacia TaxID=95486 RepID=UPI00264A96FF|nr:hypothetical protein [Burkholderia cenocepacia]MDN7684058.1 hypothetical protein [Burkholderia cenocepacia]
MARIIGAVNFKDGRRLYLIFDRTTDIALRPLFDTKGAAQQWDDEKSMEYVQPTNAVATEEPVEILTDLAFDGDCRFVFPSRASAKAMWLTGPRSVSELDEENDRMAGDGYGRPEKPVN